MKLKRFEIVRWGVENAESAKYGLSDSCCPPISLDELTSLSSGMAVPASSLVPTSAKQGYGPLEGTSALRSQLAALYSVKATTRLRPEGVLVTQGTIAANNLAFNALLEPGDHVICQYPTWQQLYDYPRAMGAEVDLWKATREGNWIPKIEDLKKLVKSNTKLIVLNNPNNPTGAILPKSLLQQIVNIASENGQIPILCDEVYRPVFHNISPMDADFPPSIMSLAYERAIVTSSLSKAYGVPGVRVGWLATRDPELASRCMDARDYCVMAVGASDQTIAAYALSGDTMSALLSRNINVARKNLELLEKFVYSNAAVLDWVKPKAGTTTFIKVSRQGQPVQSEPFCRKLLADAGVLLVPGAKCFGDEFEGYVRIGFAMETGMLEEGLRQLQMFLGSSAFTEIPLLSS